MDLSPDTIPTESLAGLIPVVLIMLVGLVIWAAGRRVLRTGFAVLALIAGAAIGWILGTGIDLGLPPALWAALLGLSLGCVAALTYRLAIAGALALVCGLAAPLGVAAISELQPINAPAAPEQASAYVPPTPVGATDPNVPRVFGAPESRLEAADGPALTSPVAPTGSGTEAATAPPAENAEGWLFGLDPDFGSYAERATPAIAKEALTERLGMDDETAASIEDAGAQARTWAGTIAATLQSWWDARPARLRPVLVGAAAAGALAGLLFGTLSTTLAAAIVSSFGGSVLWLGGLRIVLERFGTEFIPQSSQSAMIALSAWIIVALLGAAIQWRIGPAPTDKPA